MTARARAFYLLKNRIKSENRIMGIQLLLDFLKSDSTALFRIDLSRSWILCKSYETKTDLCNKERSRPTTLVSCVTNWSDTSQIWAEGWQLGSLHIWSSSYFAQSSKKEIEGQCRLLAIEMVLVTQLCDFSLGLMDARPLPIWCYSTPTIWGGLWCLFHLQSP